MPCSSMLQRAIVRDTGDISPAPRRREESVRTIADAEHVVICKIFPKNRIGKCPGRSGRCSSSSSPSRGSGTVAATRDTLRVEFVLHGTAIS